MGGTAKMADLPETQSSHTGAVPCVWMEARIQQTDGCAGAGWRCETYSWFAMEPLPHENIFLARWKEMALIFPTPPNGSKH
jgi:hypothetical protein